ncbi:hypothetical protein GUITHDRAFT_121010 [Guillardia theta CCMP2712]|uniref:RelA/SpoT domain-containing protein n=1 Tax=Guillardia theta (strain CCMP2712) TaxID=905079 RepID=L1IAA7_GUITC|nr:hypothetical protein GUITHDRAFT_121010 [Guillardia theta CCMP2712]EKX32814.1 hypothetical protein GUITHDRAFT_121010 [Guillardia theta CCMP2712]|eukprot:XP_005819794.1 hypothetical protein GUITHDRAFT_121010 [Guillardia theta CCMP2712]
MITIETSLAFPDDTLLSPARSNKLPPLGDEPGATKMPEGKEACSPPEKIFHDSHSEEQSRLAEEYVIASASRPGNALQDLADRYQHSLHARDLWKVFLSVRPISMLLLLRISRLSLLILGIIVLIFGYQDEIFLWKSVQVADYKSYRYFRFTAMMLRDGTKWPNVKSPGIAGMGLIVENCRMPHVMKDVAVIEQLPGVSHAVNGSTYELSFQDSVQSNGFYIITSNLSTELDVVSFFIEGSDDRKDWVYIAYSRVCGSVRSNDMSTKNYLKSRNAPIYNTPMRRLEVVDFNFHDMWCVWPDYSSLIARVVMFASILLGLILLHHRCPRGSTKVIAWGIVLTSLVRLGGYGGSTMNWHNDRQGLVLYQTFGDLLLFPAPLLLSEHFALEKGLMAGIYQILVTWIIDQTINSAAIFFIVVFVLLIGNREWHSFQGRQVIRQDVEQFEQAWKELTELPSFAEDVECLKAQVAATKKKFQIDSCQVPVPLQYSWSESLHSFSHLYNTQNKFEIIVQGGFDNLESKREPFLVELHSRMLSMYINKCMKVSTLVDSLDQLYAQANALKPLFLDIVQDYAEQSNGSFPIITQNSVDFVRWVDAKHNPDLLQRIKWANLKSVDRAIEKLSRSYDFHVCRLVDIVRQCIVFEDLEDLTRCLHAITEDERVEVMRVKNRFDGSYDPRQSGGYRDVCLNVRVVTERTKRLGVAGHVCELVLAMRGIYAIKEEAEHSRYLRYKKTRRHLRLRYFFTFLLLAFRLRKIGKLNRLVVLFSIDCNFFQYLKSLFAFSRVSNSEETVEMEVKSVDCDELDRTDAILRQRCSFPGDFLEARLREVWFAVKNAGQATVLFTSTPVTHALYKPWSKLLLVLVGVYACVACFSLSPEFSKSIVHESAIALRSLRFRTLEIASTADAQAVVAPGISLLGLMWNGCEIHDLTSSSFAVNEDFIVTFSSELRANGWFFAPVPVAGEQPVRFQVLASEDVAHRDNLTEVSWRVIGASSCSWSTVVPVCIPTDREKFVYAEHSMGEHYGVDLRSPWYQSIGTVLLYFPVFVLAFGSAITASMGQHRTPLGMIAACLWVPGIMELITAVGYVTSSTSSSYSVYWWVLGASSMTFGHVIQYHEEWFMLYVPVHFAVCFIGQGLQDLYISKLPLQVPEGPTFLFVIWILMHVAKKIAIKSSWKFIEEDLRHYQKIWHEICGRQGVQDQLASLASLCGSINSSPRAGVPLQGVTPVEAAEVVPAGKQGGESAMRRWACRCREMLPKDVLREQPKITLDQLYMQAMLMEDEFKLLVQQLADKSNGSFPILASDDDMHFVRWVDAKHNPDLLQRIKWANLKSIDRAIEKLSRSYDCVVARLVDIVRQCIVFEDLEDLTRCLHAITEDERVEVMRVKNRFDGSYDPRQSGGYRDVCLNVRVVTERTKRLGVAGHVCELQLVLQEYKSWTFKFNGHKRYVEFRNRRCE